MLIYLGIFDRIFNWVLDRILSPVFNFVSSLLNKVLNFIFNKVLAPILLPLLEKVFRWALDLVLDIFGSLFYFILQTFLKLIDYMEIAFDIFIGLRDVTMTQTLKDGSTDIIKGPLLEVLFELNMVRTAFLAITLAGIGLALLLTIFSVTRASMDLEMDGGKPVMKVMKDFFRCCVRFMLVPFMTVFLLNLSVIILSGLNTALTASSQNGWNATLGSTIFVISSLDAAVDERYNVNYTGSDQIDNIGPEDNLRRDYYQNHITKNYKNSKAVGGDGSRKGDFDFGEFDYLTGYLSSIFLIVVLAMCLLVFIQRIFEILILYIVSPYFVAMMPLDGGEKFDQWKDMFIAKFFTGFGSAIGMRLYLMLCFVVMGNKIRFSDGTSPESDYIIKLLFLLGGAWSVYKSSSLITMLLNEQAGASEQAAGAVAGGMMLSQIQSLPGHALSGFKGIKSGAGVGYRAIRRTPDAVKYAGKKAAFTAGNIRYHSAKISRMAVQGAAKIRSAPSSLRKVPGSMRRAPSVVSVKLKNAYITAGLKAYGKGQQIKNALSDSYEAGSFGSGLEREKRNYYSKQLRSAPLKKHPKVQSSVSEFPEHALKGNLSISKYTEIKMSGPEKMRRPALLKPPPSVSPKSMPKPPEKPPTYKKNNQTHPKTDGGGKEN